MLLLWLLFCPSSQAGIALADSLKDTLKKGARDWGKWCQAAKSRSALQMRAASSSSGLSHQERALGYVLVLSSQPAPKPMEGSPMDVRIF